jgi:hypothetical protein
MRLANAFCRYLELASSLQRQFLSETAAVAKIAKTSTGASCPTDKEITQSLSVLVG